MASHDKKAADDAAYRRRCEQILADRAHAEFLKWTWWQNLGLSGVEEEEDGSLRGDHVQDVEAAVPARPGADTYSYGMRHGLGGWTIEHTPPDMKERNCWDKLVDDSYELFYDPKTATYAEIVGDTPLLTADEEMVGYDIYNKVGGFYTLTDNKTPAERRRAWHLQASMVLQTAMARVENPPEEPKVQVFMSPLDWQAMMDELEAAKQPVFWQTILNEDFLEDFSYD
jgi:hypothetical protein